MEIPEPPTDSSIQVKANTDGVTLSLWRPSGGVVRFFIALFMIAWLGGWVLGLAFAIRELVLQERVDAFFLFWLVGWTVGGMFLAFPVSRMLSPQVPESLTLGADSFEYDTGYAPLLFWTSFMTYKGLPMNPFTSMLGIRKVCQFSKSECPEFVLDRLCAKQRLTFKDGAHSVAIGQTLNEPAREWLAELLKTWRSG